MFGKYKVFLQSDEEQGRFTLHGHCLLWMESFLEIRELFFDQNPLRRQEACHEICDYIDEWFCSDYEFSQNQHVIHKEYKACTTTQEMFDESEP